MNQLLYHSVTLTPHVERNLQYFIFGKNNKTNLGVCRVCV